jgi:hypothetical protein
MYVKRKREHDCNSGPDGIGGSGKGRENDRVKNTETH